MVRLYRTYGLWLLGFIKVITSWSKCGLFVRYIRISAQSLVGLRKYHDRVDDRPSNDAFRNLLVERC